MPCPPRAACVRFSNRDLPAVRRSARLPMDSASGSIPSKSQVATKRDRDAWEAATPADRAAFTEKVRMGQYRDLGVAKRAYRQSLKQPKQLLRADRGQMDRRYVAVHARWASHASLFISAREP